MTDSSPTSATVSTRPHTGSFAAAWRELAALQFNLEPRGQFLRVPSLIPGCSVISYLPFLNYTDLTRAEADRLADSAGEDRYLIRVLDPGCGEPEPNAPVSVRLALSGRGEEEILTRVIKPACRRKLKQAWRAGYAIEEDEDGALARHFHRFLADTLQKRHGIPTLPQSFFVALARDPKIDTLFIMLSLHGRRVAGLLLVFDGPLAWVPWMVADPSVFENSPNHLLYWRAILAARARGCDTLDFGRSPYGNPTYRFKSQWGCTPVPITLLAPAPVALYEKYALATQLWRRLPTGVARPLGGWLTRYLADL